VIVAPTRAALGAALLILGVGLPALAADEAPADVCLEIAADAASEDDWSVIGERVGQVLVQRSALFPAPTMDRQPSRLDIQSGHAGLGDGSASCLEAGAEWTARFGRAFLEAGADQMLAEAPTTPGIDSSVDLEWHADESRVRTTLVFAGPLGIPNGTCWIDDALSVDVAAGTVIASGEQGVKTSIFAESACGRFFDHLPDGGAGEQAVTLLPTTIELAIGETLHFIADAVVVQDDAIIVSGSLLRD